MTFFKRPLHLADWLGLAWARQWPVCGRGSLEKYCHLSSLHIIQGENWEYEHSLKPAAWQTLASWGLVTICSSNVIVSSLEDTCRHFKIRAFLETTLLCGHLTSEGSDYSYMLTTPLFEKFSSMWVEPFTYKEENYWLWYIWEWRKKFIHE